MNTSKGSTLGKILVQGLTLLYLESCGKETASENIGEEEIKDSEAELQYALGGGKWTNRHVSVSFMPDGTLWDGYSTNLNSHLDTVAARAVWRKEYARAIATWAKYSNLNFRVVSDNGAAFGTNGAGQADLRFGDIRMGGYAISSNGSTGYTYFPYSGGTSSRYGDYKLNTANTTGWKIGSPADIYSNVLHEIGHAVGLDHSSMGNVMFGIIMGVYSDLAADDIAGVRARYGARANDAYDAVSSNETPMSASAVNVAASGATFINGDLIDNNDMDHFRLVVPSGAQPVLSVTAVGGLSLLTPRLNLYDGSGNLIQQVSASDYGQEALIQLGGLAAGDVVILGVDSPVEDEFGMGFYRLAIEFRSSLDGIAYTAPAFLTPDTKEVNADSLEVAPYMGQISTSSTLTGLNIHWTFDEDYFSFKTASRKVNTYEVNVAYTSGTAPLEIEIYNTAGTKIAQSNGATYVRFPASVSTTYYTKIYSPTNQVRGYNLTVKKYN